MSEPFGNERGWTLIELLVAMTLMIIVLSATLTSFNAFSNNTKRNTNFNDQQDRVRNVLDQIVRQARNLANPTTGATLGSTATSIAWASDDRLVFQTTDPKKQWVSYCLKTTNASREEIWYETSLNSTLTPDAVAGGGTGTMVTNCPANGWDTKTQVADYVTNNATTTRPLFSYFSTTGALTPDPSNPPARIANTSQIERVVISVFMDLDRVRPPGEAQLVSGAYMRNQNQAPTAAFLATFSGGVYTFDGGSSSDPEGRTLAYDWYSAPAGTTTTPAVDSLPSCTAQTPDFTQAGVTGWSCLGTTVVTTATFATPKTIFLRVTDPGNLRSLSSVPAGGCPAATAVVPNRDPTNCGAVS